MTRWMAALVLLSAMLIPGLLISDPTAASSSVAVTGSVFVDFDRDGRIDPGERTDPILAGLTVRIVDATGVTTQLRTDGAGAFAADIDGAQVRIEFDTPPGYQPTFAQPFGDGDAATTTAIHYLDRPSRKDVVYGIVPDSSCPVDPTGVGAPSLAAPNGNPNSPRGKVWTACFIDGARDGPTGPQDVLVGANFDATGWNPSNPRTGFGGHLDVEHIGTRSQLGAVWGVAYDEWDGVLFTSAVIKRHVDLGPEGIDGLYWFDVGADGTNLAVTSIGLDSLSPAEAPSFGDEPPNCPMSSGVYDYDNFTTSASAAGGSWDCRDLRSGGGQNYDWWAYDRTGRSGIGDIDVTPDGHRLLVMNATADAVFVYAISTGTPVYERHLDIADPGCRGGVFEAWATTAIDAESAYIGVTCTASDSGKTADLDGHVVQLDITSGEQRSVSNVNFGYTHGPGWSAQPGPRGGDFQPWVAPVAGVPTLPPLEESAGIVYLDFADAYGYANGWDHHQPVLSDIEIDSFDDSLVLAVMDRWAMMTGVFNCDLDPHTDGCGFMFPAPPPGNYDGVPGEDPVTSYTSGIIGYVAGDLLRLCTTSDGGGFVLEGAVGCDPGLFSPTFSPPYGGGPAGGTEWYWNDQAFTSVQTQNAHPEAAQGAVYIADRRHDVVYTAMNPIETFGAGLSWDSNRDGAHVNGLQFYRTDLDNRDGTAFKSAGLGDVEGCSIPIEVGNHVWFDENVNGSRDPGESPIAGIGIDLLDAVTGTLVATTLSDEGGNYYFGSADGVQPNTVYVFEFSVSSLTDTAALGIPRSDLRETVTGLESRDDLDSDLVAGRIEFTTGDPGQNDHTLDAGFGPASELPDAPAPEERDLDAAGEPVSGATPGDGGGGIRLQTVMVVVASVLAMIVALVLSLRWSWNRE